MKTYMLNSPHLFSLPHVSLTVQVPNRDTSNNGKWTQLFKT